MSYHGTGINEQLYNRLYASMFGTDRVSRYKDDLTNPGLFYDWAINNTDIVDYVGDKDRTIELLKIVFEHELKEQTYRYVVQDCMKDLTGLWDTKYKTRDEAIKAAKDLYWHDLTDSERKQRYVIAGTIDENYDQTLEVIDIIWDSDNVRDESRYTIEDYDTGSIIEYAQTYDEAYHIILGYEESDKRDGCYTPGFYAIRTPEGDLTRVTNLM